MLFVGDTLVGSRDGLVCGRERVVGGVERRTPGVDGGPVALGPVSLVEVFELGASVDDGLCGLVVVVLLVVEVGLGSGERVVGVVGEAADDSLEVGEVGVSRAAKLFDTEGEWVVGVHGAQGDVGPVMRERVIDLGDAFDPPLLLVVPCDTLGNGFLATFDATTRVVERGGGAGEAALRAGDGLVGAGDVISSAVALGG